MCCTSHTALRRTSAPNPETKGHSLCELNDRDRAPRRHASALIAEIQHGIDGSGEDPNDDTGDEDPTRRGRGGRRADETGQPRALTRFAERARE